MYLSLLRESLPIPSTYIYTYTHTYMHSIEKVVELVLIWSIPCPGGNWGTGMQSNNHFEHPGRLCSKLTVSFNLVQVQLYSVHCIWIHIHGVSLVTFISLVCMMVLSRCVWWRIDVFGFCFQLTYWYYYYCSSLFTENVRKSLVTWWCREDGRSACAVYMYVQYWWMPR